MLQMQKSLKTYILYSFLMVIIFYNHDFCNTIPPGFIQSGNIVESLESLNNQNNEDDKQHQLNNYDKLQTSNNIEDFKVILTTEELNRILKSKIQFYKYPKSDVVFIKKLLLTNKSPPLIF